MGFIYCCLLWPVFHFKEKNHLSLFAVQPCFSFPLSLLWNRLENLPSEQMVSAGRRVKLEPGLCTLHTHTHFLFPSTSVCKREQWRSIGNSTMGLFWETEHTFVYCIFALGSMQAAVYSKRRGYILATLCKLESRITPTHSLWSLWSPSSQYMFIICPYMPTEWNVKTHLHSKLIYSMLVRPCLLLNKEWGNATVSHHSFLHSSLWHFKETLAVGKPGV